MRHKIYLSLVSGGALFLMLGLASSAHAFNFQVPKPLRGFTPQAAPRVEIGRLAQESTPGSEEETRLREEAQQGEEMDQRRREEEGRQLQDIKRGSKQMMMGVRNFESMIKQAERDKIPVPQEIKDRITKIKSLAEAVGRAVSLEELQDLGMEEIQDHFAVLEEFRSEVVEKAMRLREMRRGLRGLENGLKMFDRQLVNLKKQKVTIPPEVSETLEKIKSILGAVKKAQTWEDVEEAGAEELGDLMEQLNDWRQKLEHLARWPKTLAQIERDLKRLNQELKRSKGLVDRLSKKGIDLSALYAEFEAAIGALKTAKDKAAELMQQGNAEEAFEILDQEFFGAMDDVWEIHRIIMTMSNLGRFTSDFKRGISEAERTIRNLERRKIDTSALKTLLTEAKTKGQAIIEMMKTKQPDTEAILAALQEMENQRGQFEDLVEQLTGEEEDRPWETGPSTFKEKTELPGNWEKFVPRKPAPPPSPEQPPTTTPPPPATEPTPAP